MKKTPIAVVLTVLSPAAYSASVIHQYDAAADSATPSIIEDQVGSKNFSATNVVRGTTATTFTTFTHSYSLSSTSAGSGGNTGPFFNPTSQDHSYELWVKLGTLSSTYQVIFETGAQGAGTGIFVNDTEFRIQQGDGNAVNYELTVPLAQINTTDYVQITVSIDDTNDDVRLFVKGAAGGDEFREDLVGTVGSGNNDAGLFAPASGGSNTLSSGNTGGVGNPNSITSVAAFAGEIALFNVWDDNLTAGEVDSAFAANFVPEPSSVLLTGLGAVAMAGSRRRARS